MKRRLRRSLNFPSMLDPFIANSGFMRNESSDLQEIVFLATIRLVRVRAVSVSASSQPETCDNLQRRREGSLKKSLSNVEAVKLLDIVYSSSRLASASQYAFGDSCQRRHRSYPRINSPLQHGKLVSAECLAPQQTFIEEWYHSRRWSWGRGPAYKGHRGAQQALWHRVGQLKIKLSRLH